MALLAFTASFMPPARAETAEVDAKLASLAAALKAPGVQKCLDDFILLRRLANTCTRALESLVDPVAEAKAALAAEEERLRTHACPSLADYGCTSAEIAYRNAADKVAHARWNLRLTEEVALGDRHEGAWWDRWFLKDNRLSAIWAGDFVEKAKADWVDALRFLKAL